MASSSASSPEISSALPTNTRDQPTAYKYSSIDDVLEELSSRFILNLPEEELSSVERICFQVEQAHWYYEDFIRENNSQFPSLPLKKFSEMLFQSCPLIQHWSADHERAFDNFMQYKTRVPVCGAIMLNSSWDKCVLVKGWKASSGWGFPKGKINEDEPPHKCAVREVLEETGYDLAKQINPEHAIIVTIKEQRISLYIVPGVPEDYPFQTKTRKEISKIEWFRLVDLPTWKRNKTVAGKFYLISPFIGPLKNFINEHKPRDGGRRRNGVNNQTQRSAPQGSSPQSSSATDPQTPSPQHVQSIADPAVIQAEPDAPMDPQLARLLTSLSLSATPLLQNADAKPPSATDSYDSASLTSVSESYSRPASTAPSSDPAWSPAIATAQQDHEARSQDYTPVRGMNGQNTHAPPSLNMNATLAPISTQNPPLTSPTPTSATLSTTSATTTSSASPFISRSTLPRRTSVSTSDMSPYLPRSAELPTSGKRMKQLALLESITGSDGTPQQPSQPRPPTAMSNGNFGQPTTSPLIHTGHAQVPSQPLSNGNPSWVRPPYDMHQGPVGQAPFPSITPSPLVPHRPATSVPVYDDPFQVRPRTSIAMHGPLYPTPRNPNEGHLLSLLKNGGGAVAVNGHAPLPSHPSLGGQYPGPMPPPQISDTGRVLAPSAMYPSVPSALGPIPSQLRSMPSQHHVPPPPLGHGPFQPVSSNMALPPGFVPMSGPDGQVLPLPHPPLPPPSRAATANPNLLSILNNPGASVLAAPMGPR